MATIVNTPGTRSEDSGVGLILGVLIALVLIVLFFVYVLPTWGPTVQKAETPSTDLNIKLSSPTPAPAPVSPAPAPSTN